MEPGRSKKSCGCSSMVEPQPSKLKTRVRFPSPALASGSEGAEQAATGKVQAAVAQLVERVLGKDEVTGPTPVSSSWTPQTSSLDLVRFRGSIIVSVFRSASCTPPSHNEAQV